MGAGNELLNGLLSSEVKAQLLLLFHKNPGLIDTIDGVARRIGRTARAVEADMKDLVDLGLLKAKKLGRSEVIHLDRARDKEIQETITNYLRSLETGKGV